MDAGLLDMLHDAGDDDGLAVGEHVDVDLDRILEVAVDQDRAVLGRDRGLRGELPRRRPGEWTIRIARPPST